MERISFNFDKPKSKITNERADIIEQMYQVYLLEKEIRFQKKIKDKTRKQFAVQLAPFKDKYDLCFMLSCMKDERARGKSAGGWLFYNINQKKNESRNLERNKWFQDKQSWECIL